MTEIIITFGILIWQGGIFDYTGWFVIMKERTGHKLEWLYRLLKELHDFPLTITALALAGVEFSVILAIFVMKWFSWADAFYILMYKICNKWKVYFEKGKEIWWLWWTPLGLFDSEIVYRETPPNEVNQHLFIRLWRNWYLKKGILTEDQFYWQLGVSLAGGILIMYKIPVYISLRLGG